MEIIGTIVSAVIVFGLLIFIHEFGHYIFARIFGVTVHEFAIGMGPKLFKYKSKKTDITYAIGCIPFGGYVAMAGEDGESDDPNSFDKKPAWQRLIITVAGATVNVVAGFLAMLIFTCLVNYGGTTVAEFVDKEVSGFEISSADSGLQVGDLITEVNGNRVSIGDELSYELMRHGTSPVTLTVVRGGEEIILENVVFPTVEQNGESFGMMDFKIFREEKTVGTVLKYSWAKSVLIVRMCWETLYDLITGRYGINAISGPVGISTAIGDAARANDHTIIYIFALISINLGIMNMLPVPALDGGRSVMLLFEMITKKRIPVKIEGIINGVALLLLMLFSVFIMIKDIFQLVG